MTRRLAVVLPAALAPAARPFTLEKTPEVAR